MSALVYRSGEPVRVGDRVRLHGDEGSILLLDDELASWGLAEEERKGRVMIRCTSFALVCTSADDAHLDFVGRAEVAGEA